MKPASYPLPKSFIPLRALPRRAVRPVSLATTAAQLWLDAEGLRMSAAMSFYGMLSLAPLLLVLVALMGWWMDASMLQSNLVEQVRGVAGAQAAELVGQAMASAQAPAEGVLASLFAIGLLVVGATGVFAELQAAFEAIWQCGPDRRAHLPWWHSASLRLRGIAYILAIGFLLLVSLVISTVVGVVTRWAGDYVPMEPLLLVLNEGLAFAICTALFLSLMRMSAGAKPRLRHLALGAAAGASLFTLGKHVLAFYLSTAPLVSAYGAAGSLVVVLMWIYFSSAVLLLSAALARALALHSDTPVEEQPNATTASVLPQQM
ncbi:MAG: YihY/virulence factor BrkB family protein [Pseudomonadota bacterium]